MSEEFEATVRKHTSLGKTKFGKIVSKKLSPYVNKRVKVNIKEDKK